MKWTAHNIKLLFVQRPPLSSSIASNIPYKNLFKILLVNVTHSGWINLQIVGELECGSEPPGSISHRVRVS